MRSRPRKPQQVWFAAIGGVLVAVVFALRWSAAPPAVAAPPPTAAAPLPPLATSAAPPSALGDQRSELTTSRLQIVDWQQRPVAAKLTWLVGDGLQQASCPVEGSPIPAGATHLLVQQPDWLPLCFAVGALDVDGTTAGQSRLQLPPPSLTAHVMAPPSALAPELYAEVEAASVAAAWPARLRALVFPAPPVPLTLALHCTDGQLAAGGLPAGDFALHNRGELVFRSAAGISDRWQVQLPVHGAVIELVARPLLRVTPTLAAGCVLDCEMKLLVDQRDAPFTSSMQTQELDARLDLANAVPLDPRARHARLLLRAVPDARLLAMATVQLTGNDQDETLWIGRNAFTITVVDGTDAPVADACVLDQDELLAITDARGEALLLATGSGPIDAMARGFDCAQVPLAELQQTRRIVLPPLTTLVIDARQAARAMGRGCVRVRGDFVSPCSSRVGDRLISGWNESQPNASSGSGMNGGRIMLDELTYSVTAERELRVAGLLRAGGTVQVRLCDAGHNPTGSTAELALVRGEENRIELPVPQLTCFLGEVVAAGDGQSIPAATVSLRGGWPPMQPLPVPGGRLDLRLAKDESITVSAPGYVLRTFAAPVADGRYRLWPARQLNVRVVDAAQDMLACTATLVDADGNEYSAGARRDDGSMPFEAVPDRALVAKLRHGDDVRELTVPAGVTSYTLVWR